VQWSRGPISGPSFKQTHAPTSRRFSAELIATGRKLGGCPIADVIDQRKDGLAVNRLGVQEFVVAQRDRVFGQRNHLGIVERKLPDGRRHLRDQTTQVVRVLKLDPPRPEQSLEPLLDSLLSGEADDL